MKILIDQNISPKITKYLDDEFSESRQVRQLGIENYSDLKIYQYAKLNEFTILTFDSDFIDLAIVKGSPPKIIWIRTFDQTTKKIVRLLNSNKERIAIFIDSEAANILELHAPQQHT